MNVRKFLWDYEAPDERLEVLSEDPEFVARVLSFGDADEAKELCASMGRGKVVASLRSSGYKLDKRSHNYWRTYFALPAAVAFAQRPFAEGVCWEPY